MNRRTTAFTLVELLIVITIMAFVLVFAYKLFFSQTRAVTQSIEVLQVNDNFRRILSIMGGDIKEASNIKKPLPVALSAAAGLKTEPGVVLVLETAELNPRIKFDSTLGGQIETKHTITYELEEASLSPSQNENTFKLIRNETVEEQDGQKTKQRQAIADNIKEFIVYRIVKLPFEAHDVSSKNDRLVEPLAMHKSGTGNNVVHVKMLLERTRRPSEKTADVYHIEMNTAFYKRGKEIFDHP